MQLFMHDFLDHLFVFVAGMHVVHVALAALVFGFIIYILAYHSSCRAAKSDLHNEIREKENKLADDSVHALFDKKRSEFQADLNKQYDEFQKELDKKRSGLQSEYDKKREELAGKYRTEKGKLQDAERLANVAEEQFKKEHEK